MGAGSSHEFVQGPVADLPSRTAEDNALGLSSKELADVRRLHGLMARDASSHCVHAHIKYFRRHPEHLERFCGRGARREPLHYAPVQLAQDAEFTARALMHGLAQLQILRCSCSGDMDLLASQMAGIAHAHRGLGLTRDALRKYREVLIAYLASAFPQTMTASTRESWSTFLTTVTDSLWDAMDSEERNPAGSARSAVRRLAWTSSWLEGLNRGWLLQPYRGKLNGNQRGKVAAQSCSSCRLSVCSCKREAIHLSRAWSNDLGAFPSLLEDTELESYAVTERDESQSGSEAFPAGMSASCLAED